MYRWFRRKKKDKGKLHKVECDNCGNWFKAKRLDARYCSSKCRVAAWRARLDING